jgi:hypothetical protein
VRHLAAPVKTKSILIQAGSEAPLPFEGYLCPCRGKDGAIQRTGKGNRWTGAETDRKKIKLSADTLKKQPLLYFVYSPLFITGGGEKSFVAGADIKEMVNLTPSEAQEYSRAGSALMDAIEDFPAPVIAAGYTLGGGFELALACDIRMASENAVFVFPEVSLGILPSFGGIKRIVTLFGPGRAKELLFTARRVMSAETLSLGIVNSFHPSAELIPEALKTAARIAGNAPGGWRR